MKEIPIELEEYLTPLDAVKQVLLEVVSDQEPDVSRRKIIEFLEWERERDELVMYNELSGSGQIAVVASAKSIRKLVLLDDVVRVFPDESEDVVSF